MVWHSAAWYSYLSSGKRARTKRREAQQRWHRKTWVRTRVNDDMVLGRRPDRRVGQLPSSLTGFSSCANWQGKAH